MSWLSISLSATHGSSNRFLGIAQDIFDSKKKCGTTALGCAPATPNFCEGPKLSYSRLLNLSSLNRTCVLTSHVFELKLVRASLQFCSKGRCKRLRTSEGSYATLFAKSASTQTESQNRRCTVGHIIHRLLQSKIMESKLLLIPWMIAVLYSSIPLFWFVIHPFARRWQRMSRSPYRALLPVWFAMIAGLGWITWPWHSQQLYSTSWTWITALPFLLAGVRVYRRIFSEFGAHKVSGEAELRPREHRQELVTTGLHRSARHPIYLAHLCNLAGWALGSGLLMVYVLLAVNAFITFPVMVYIEERELEERFGESFREYKSRVPLVPWPRFKGKVHEQTATR